MNANIVAFEKNFWIDIDNSPHVPFFKPIINELENKGYKVIVTTRDAFQTCEMADYHKISHRCIGKHSGKNKLHKILGLFYRAIKLAIYIAPYKPVLAISHGSRSQLICTKFLNIKSVIIFDYEHTTKIPFVNPSYIIVPQILRSSNINFDVRYTFRYDGIKEDVYVPFFQPDKIILDNLDIDQRRVIVTIRPPATEAHYHRSESEDLFIEVMNYLLSKNNLTLVILPRSNKQKQFTRRKWENGFSNGKMIIPDFVVNGLNLIWFSDLVISGGGTMNREAAALGVPVYSIFKGEIGAVDQYLHDMGRLHFIRSINDVKKISFVKRTRLNNLEKGNYKILNQIIGFLQSSIKTKA